MISKLLALLRNQPSSPEEEQLEDALRNEASRIRAEDEDDEVAIATILDRARRRPRIREKLPAAPWVSAAPSLLGAAAVLALILILLRPGNQSNPEESAPRQATQPNPAAETLFAEPVKTLTEPFAPLAFNPLEPVTEEWSRFAGDTHSSTISLLVSAKAWVNLPAPAIPIDTRDLLPDLPGLHDFSPYGNELQRLRNDAIDAFEALPFLPNLRG